MNELTRPVPLATLILGIGLFAFGQSVMGAIALVAWIAVLALGSLRRTAELRAEEVSDTLDPESRALFAPIKRLVAEIEEVVARNGDSAVIRTVGKEAEAEAGRIRDQMVRALTIRGELKRALRGRATAERETDDLEERLTSATSDEERASLNAALAARKQELEHYVGVEKAVHGIDRNVQEARAALSEMKARLATSASGERAETGGSADELRDSLSTLKALSVSYDEAEEVLRG